MERVQLWNLGSLENEVRLTCSVVNFNSKPGNRPHFIPLMMERVQLWVAMSTLWNVAGKAHTTHATRPHFILLMMERVQLWVHYEMSPVRRQKKVCISFLWRPKPRNGTNIPIQSSHIRNMSLIWCRPRKENLACVACTSRNQCSFFRLIPARFLYFTPKLATNI
jgi:hypothetical protein